MYIYLSCLHAHAASTILERNNTKLTASYGKDFYVGFMRNIVSTTRSIKLIISTEDSMPVKFNIATTNGVVYSGTTTVTNTVTVNLPTSLIVKSASYNYRNNGVHVYTTGLGFISVLAIDTKWVRGEYLAYPCQDAGSSPYEYYIVSTLTPKRSSEFLLVGCNDNTTITITPTQTVSIPADIQSSSSSFVSVSKGNSHQVILHNMQTLLISKRSVDLTGSRIVSNKPLTVISGHECSKVPSKEPYGCDHLAEQIQPTSTWGREFFLVPFGGRDAGQYYKIMSSQDATIVIRTCNSMTASETLSSAGNYYTFFTTSNTYCFVVANKPILVAQLGLSRVNKNDIGSPILSIIPSLDQYRNRYSFKTFNTTDFNIHQISVSVPAQYYQPNSIRLDGQPLMCLWNPIYTNRGSIVGYGCHQNVTGGTAHIVSHYNPIGKLAVLVHGWSLSKGYGYFAASHYQSGTLWTLIVSMIYAVHLGSMISLTKSYFGSISGPVRFGGVQCVGNESKLLDCSYNTQAQCSSFQQAGLLCPGNVLL